MADLSRSGASREQLEQGFAKARLFSEGYFPKMGQILAFAGITAPEPERLESVNANAAWEWVMRYVSANGCDGMPEFRGGKLIPAPAIPDRIEYALRRIGGLKAMRAIGEKEFPFMLRDFTEGFNEFPLSEDGKPLLWSGEALKKALGTVRQLAGIAEMPLNRKCGKCGWVHAIGSKCPDPDAAFGGGKP